VKIAPLDLKREDFPKLEGDKLDDFLRALNGFATQVASVLAGGILFKDNVKSFSKNVTIQAGAFPVSIKNELGSTPSHVLVTRAVSVSGSTETPVTVGTPAWAVSRDQIVISDCSNVLAGTTYRVRILVLAE
jgi:hypothetical protein